MSTEPNDLYAFFPSLMISHPYLEKDMLDAILYRVLELRIDYSNTHDLMPFSAYSAFLSEHSEWISQVLDKLIHFRRANHINDSLVQSLLPAFCNNHLLIDKALNYLQDLSHVDNRFPSVTRVASCIKDKDRRFKIISQQLTEIQRMLESDLHKGEVISIGNVLSQIGPIISQFEDEFNTFLEIIEQLEESIAYATALASLRASPYFSDDLRYKLQKSVLRSLFDSKSESKERVWGIVSYEPFVEALNLSPNCLQELLDTIISIERDWNWL